MNWLLRWCLILAIALMVGCSAYGKHIEKGDAHFKNGDYASALAYYEKALEIEPESEEAQQRVSQTKGMLVSEYKAEAEQALQAGDPLGAVMAAKKAYYAAPDNQMTQRVIDMATSAADTRSRELVTSKDFSTGLMLAESVVSNLPPAAAEFTAIANNIKREWAIHLDGLSSVATQNLQFGSALLLNAKIVQLTGDSVAVANVQNLKEQLNSNYTYRVLLKPKPSKLNANIAGRVAQFAVGTLKIGMNIGGEVAAQIAFGATQPRFDKKVTSRTEVVRYQSGTRQVSNPFYQSRLDDLEREERQLLRYQDDVTRYEDDVSHYQEQVAKEGPSPNTSTGAEQSLSRARSSLESARRNLSDQRHRVQSATEDVRREPQFKEEPVYSDWEYRVQTHTLIASTDLNGNLKHTDPRSPIKVAKTVTSTAVDDTNEPQPIPGVSGDPLDLPTNQEMTTALAAESSKVLVETVDQSFALWREDKLQQALSAGSGATRADQLAIYIYTDPRRSAPEAGNVIKAELGIPDAVALLDGLYR